MKIPIKKILIIHPEGNINYNVNLTNMVEILVENDYEVHVYSIKRPNIFQGSPCQGAFIHLVDPAPGVTFEKQLFLLLRQPAGSFEETVKNIYNEFHRYDLVIGVDRGIIEADFISSVVKVPCGLLSYEIFFSDETERIFKKPEIEACANIDFAICQDSVRSNCLSRENRIPLEKIINIPISGRLRQPLKKQRYFHEKFNLDENSKIALYIGAFGNWSLLDSLIESTESWPDSWYLILHHRYGKKKVTDDLMNKYSKYPRLLFSFELIENSNQMNKLVSSADAGIAFYYAEYESIWSGKNLKFIGMASGKIATYLQNGIPVVINEIGEMSDHVRNHHLGFVLEPDKKQEFKAGMKNALSSINNNFNFYKNNCFNFFNLYLDLNNSIKPLLKKISRLIKRPSANNSEDNNLNINRFESILLHGQGLDILKAKKNKTMDEIYHLSSFYQKVGDKIKAVRGFKKVLQISNENSIRGGALFHLGEIELKHGNRQKALSLFLKCLSLIPNHIKAKEYLTEPSENGLKEKY